MKHRTNFHSRKIIGSGLGLGVCLVILGMLVLTSHVRTSGTRNKNSLPRSGAEGSQAVRTSGFSESGSEDHQNVSGAEKEKTSVNSTLKGPFSQEENSQDDLPPNMSSSKEESYSTAKPPSLEDPLPQDSWAEESTASSVDPWDKEPDHGEEVTEETSSSKEETPLEESSREQGASEDPDSSLEPQIHVHTLGTEVDPFGNGTMLRQTCTECGAWMQKIAVVEEIPYETVFWTDPEEGECSRVFYEPADREAFRDALFSQGITSSFLTGQIEYRIVDWTITYSDNY